MNSRSRVDRHVDSATALDYFEARLDAAARRAVEEHLATSCAPCRDRVRALGRLVERMRADRGPEVPDAWRARARAAFEAHERPERAPRRASSLARLLGDSWAQPLPFAARRVGRELRRWTFALGDDVLELESELEAAEYRTLSGRLRASDPPMHRIELHVRRERFVTWPDSDGSFTFERVPLGSLRLAVRGPVDRFRIPRLE